MGLDMTSIHDIRSNLCICVYLSGVHFRRATLSTHLPNRGVEWILIPGGKINYFCVSRLQCYMTHVGFGVHCSHNLATLPIYCPRDTFK
jgi:hypothetical protein